MADKVHHDERARAECRRRTSGLVDAREGIETSRALSNSIVGSHQMAVEEWLAPRILDPRRRQRQQQAAAARIQRHTYATHHHAIPVIVARERSLFHFLIDRTSSTGWKKRLRGKTHAHTHSHTRARDAAVRRQAAAGGSLPYRLLRGNHFVLTVLVSQRVIVLHRTKSERAHGRVGPMQLRMAASQ